MSEPIVDQMEKIMKLAQEMKKDIEELNDLQKGFAKASLSHLTTMPLNQTKQGNS